MITFIQANIHHQVSRNSFWWSAISALVLGLLQLFQLKVLDVTRLSLGRLAETYGESNYNEKHTCFWYACRSSILALSYFSGQNIHYLPSESLVCITLTCMTLFSFSMWFILFWVFGHKVSNHLLVNCHWHVSSCSMWQYNVIVPFLQNEMKMERPFPLYETPHPFRRN